MNRVLSEKETSQIFEQLFRQPGNEKCADCLAKCPLWVSLDFGIFICMNCSGGHRALGRNITRVRSVKIDQWKQHHIEIMKRVGNQKANQYWESNERVSVSRPTLDSSLEHRNRFCHDKYVRMKFINASKRLVKPIDFEFTRNEDIDIQDYDRKNQSSHQSHQVTKRDDLQSNQSNNNNVDFDFDFDQQFKQQHKQKQQKQQQSQQVDLLDMDDSPNTQQNDFDNFDFGDFQSSTNQQQPQQQTSQLDFFNQLYQQPQQQKQQQQQRQQYQQQQQQQQQQQYYQQQQSRINQMFNNPNLFQQNTTQQPQPQQNYSFNKMNQNQTNQFNLMSLYNR